MIEEFESLNEDAMVRSFGREQLVQLRARIVTLTPPGEPAWEPEAQAERTTTKPVLLSYEPSDREKVARVYNALTKLGVDCFTLDAGGTPGVNHLGSPVGANGAMCGGGLPAHAAVICFMSQEYQDSAACKLELEKAMQSESAHWQHQVEIIPVAMQGGGWRADGWLRALTGGVLWAQLHSEDHFEENLRRLHRHTKKVAAL